MYDMAKLILLASHIRSDEKVYQYVRRAKVSLDNYRAIITLKKEYNL